MSTADVVRAGLADDSLLVRKCAACGRAAHPPLPGCPWCGHDQGEDVAASGRGTLLTWTVCHVAFDPAFADEVPYTVGLIELAEGARVLARIPDDPDSLTPDLAVVAGFVHRADGPTLLTFTAEEADPPS